eukprot:2315618-Amphidinium_carterae.1
MAIDHTLDWRSNQGAKVLAKKWERGRHPLGLILRSQRYTAHIIKNDNMTLWHMPRMRSSLTRWQTCSLHARGTGRETRGVWGRKTEVMLTLQQTLDRSVRRRAVQAVGCVLPALAHSS